MDLVEVANADDQKTPFNIAIQTGLVDGVQGSASFSVNKTRVLCTVQERDGSLGGAHSDQNSLTVNVILYPYGKQSGPEESYWQNLISYTLRQTLMENMLRDCNLVVKLQVLSNHGSLLAACINALYLALLDGCIPQRNQLCAVSLCTLKDKDEMVCFPDSKQEALANASFLLVHTIKNGIVQREEDESPYSWECSGEFTQEQFEYALESSSEAASQLHSKINNVVSSRF